MLMFDLFHLPGTSFSFGISRREPSIMVGGRGSREKRESDQHTELGRLTDLCTGQGKMVSKLYKVNKRKIIPLVTV